MYPLLFVAGRSIKYVLSSLFARKAYLGGGTGDRPSFGLFLSPGRLRDTVGYIQQETFSLEVIQQAAVESQREVRTGTVANPIACPNSATSHSTNTQDNSLILIEHRQSKQASHATHIGQRRDSANHLFRPQAMSPGACNKVGLDASQAR